MEGWFDHEPEPELPTPGPCPQCGRENYKVRKLQREWAEAGRALCHQCWRRYQAPVNPSRTSASCPACGRNVKLPGLCTRCTEEGYEPQRLDI